MAKTAKTVMNRRDWEHIMELHNLGNFLQCGIIVSTIINVKLTNLTFNSILLNCGPKVGCLILPNMSSHKAMPVQRTRCSLKFGSTQWTTIAI